MVKITKQLVSKSIENSVTNSGTNGRDFITVHQTGNTDRGANAQMHANLQSNGNSRAASWHIQVDDHEAIQSFPYTARTWNAGDGLGDGNNNSISVELCINSDGDYNKTLENGAKVVKYLMDKFSIPIGNVRRHYDWSGKWCPAQILNEVNGIGWVDFKNMVQTGEKASGSTAKPTTGKSIDELAREVIKGSHGTGEERKRNLGDKYRQVQDRVNEILTGKDSKSIDELAQEVLNGEHGSGQARKDSLGGQYDEVQKRVNEMLGFNSNTKSNREVAVDVINGEYGSGQAREENLAKAGYDYDAVQAEVNDIIYNGEGNVGNGRSISVGDKVTVPAGKLYGTGNSKTAVNSTPRTGYVETVNQGWTNPYRITKSRYGSDYLGFYRP